MTQKIAIIGLGSMGFGMAKSILAAGHHAYGFDVNSEAVGRFVALGGQTGQVSEMA
jgi:L-threonate 2-dehydrogenase